MRYKTLGKTGLKVAEFGFGGWGIGGNAAGESLGSADDTTSLAALNRAYELGFNLFVTADRHGHGHSEALIGQALKGWKQDQVIIATQGGYDFRAETLEKTREKTPGGKPNFSEAYLKAAVENSLRRLGVEAIDLYLLQTPPLELIQNGQVFQALDDLKKAGLIRFSGVSIHDPQEGIQAIGKIDVIMAIYNLFDPRMEKQLFQACEDSDTGLLIREPLARGFLAEALSENTVFEKGDVRAVWPKPLIAKRLQAAKAFLPLAEKQSQTLSQLALAYALHPPAVASVLPDCKTPTEVENNCMISELPPLSDNTLAAIRQIQGTL